LYGITGRTFRGEHCDIGFEERSRNSPDEIEPTVLSFVSPTLAFIAQPSTPNIRKCAIPFYKMLLSQKILNNSI
jgi:hypothetical protein